MRSRLLPFLVILLVGNSTAAQLQLVGESDATTVRVRGVEQQGTLDGPYFQATWRFGPDGTDFDLQATTQPDGSKEARFHGLAAMAVDAYLDHRVHFAKQGVTADKPATALITDMNTLVRAAAQQFEDAGVFEGFSPAALAQLERLLKIDWTQANTGIDAGSEQDKYLAIYYYVRAQRSELERLVLTDLATLKDVPVWGLQPVVEELPPSMPTVCGAVFDSQEFLCALDLTASTDLLGLPDAILEERTVRTMLERTKEINAPVAAVPKLRKRDRWLKDELDALNERIERMDQSKELWAVRDRLDDVEGQIQDLRLEVRELRDERPATPPSDNPLANLSVLTGRNITVRFGRNSDAIEADYQVILNEVFEQLARSPQDRVLITGYTDRSGDPAVNLALSERRAKVVRNYLLQRGITAERLLVNFYGDSRSDGRNPGERRVEVEWLQ